MRQTDAAEHITTPYSWVVKGSPVYQLVGPFLSPNKIIGLHGPVAVKFMPVDWMWGLRYTTCY